MSSKLTKDILEWIDEQKLRLSEVYDGLSKLIVIKEEVGLQKLEEVTFPNDPDYYLIDILRNVHKDCMDSVILGICSLYDTNSKATSLKSILNHVINDGKRLGLKQYKNRASELLNEINTITTKPTMNKTYESMKDARDTSIAHSDKSAIANAFTFNIMDLFDFSKTTWERAQEIYTWFGVNDKFLYAPEEHGIPNSLSVIIDCYRNGNPPPHPHADKI